MRVYVIESSVTLQGADPKVTSADVEKLQRQATEMLDRPTGVIIHRSPAWFKVDGGQKTLEPVDQKGSTLEGMIGFVLADQFFINDVTERLRELNIEVRGFFSTSVGEAMQMIPYEERDHTAMLVDVGYLSTEVMAVEGDALIWQKVLPIGGVREKLLAAYRMGVTNILLPKENEKDLEEIDPEILQKLDVKLISTVDEAMKLVLTKETKMRLAI